MRIPTLIINILAEEQKQSHTQYSLVCLILICKSRYRAITSAYYRGVVGALLVYDTTYYDLDSGHLTEAHK